MASDVKQDESFNSRFAFDVELRFGFNKADYVILRHWFIDWEFAFRRINKGRKCYWPHAWVRVLGASFGAGIYYQPKLNDGAERK
jgi:hypothetical protein